MSALVAFASGLFILIICVLMIANYVQIVAMDPVGQPELLALREEFARTPDLDPVMVDRIRALDFLSRKAYFTSQTQLSTGARLLFGAAVVFLISMRLAARWNPKPPGPPLQSAAKGHWGRQALLRELIILSAMVLMIAAAIAALFTPLDFPPLSMYSFIALKYTY